VHKASSVASSERPNARPAGLISGPASTPSDETLFPIVGLGASAGGLEALEQFFHAMPAASGMGFVVVQHLDPSHHSMLTDILGRSTTMPVVEAQDQMCVVPNRVHVIPPNRDMVILRGRLQLSAPSEPRGQRMPIDTFLRSLADERGEQAAGIILSGTGSDGTLGLRAIMGAGGVCLVQEPGTAKYDGMPTSAIQAGYATQVLPVEGMPQALRNGSRVRVGVGQGEPATPPVSTSGLAKILMLLRAGTGHDFSLYKKSTIGRRIERRMAQHGIEDTGVYARYLREHPEEVQALFRELLINVTSFFRDPESFAELRSTILPALLTDKPDGYVFRAWVAGCATGEEAYSIAIVLREVMEDLQRDLKVQIYSTDLDDEAITAARTELYPANIEQDLSPERLRRFFTKEDAGLRVKKDIREMVVFAVQSLIKDPPFTRLDLLACRNVMIYLEPELQNRLIPAFHYALKPGGVLFLSPSESVGDHAELFEPLNRKLKLYRARPTVASTRSVLGGGLSWATDTATRMPPDQRPTPREPQIADIARRTLLMTFAPASVITDAQGNILYVHGDTGKFLRPAPGQPSLNVVDMAREGLQIELREAIRQAATLGISTLNRALSFSSDSQLQSVVLSVRPVVEPDGVHGRLLVTFQEPAGTPSAHKPKSRSKASSETRQIEALERDLAQAKESMTAMLEEQQASNEELKSTNEELQSTNEELQSTNEELETSKEELQSVNEELVTVNAELQNKITEMAGMQDDMKNLLDNIRVGTIFLDTHLVIRRFTRDATRVYRLQGTDVGRPLADIRSELGTDDLLADAKTVLASLVPLEREICTAAQTWYLARIQPYRTEDNRIDGVVLTFVDVTERVQAIAARKARDLAEAVVDTVNEPLVVLDGALQVVSANRAYLRAFGGSASDTVGRGFFEQNQGLWDCPAVHVLLEHDLPREREIERRPVLLGHPDRAPQQVSLTARRIADQGGHAELVLLVIEPGA
jgi:two-component system CheB/CheR fusion protein